MAWQNQAEHFPSGLGTKGGVTRSSPLSTGVAHQADPDRVGPSARPGSDPVSPILVTCDASHWAWCSLAQLATSVVYATFRPNRGSMMVVPRGDPVESLNLRVSPDIKRQVVAYAYRMGISINAAAAVLLAKGLSAEDRR